MTTVPEKAYEVALSIKDYKTGRLYVESQTVRGDAPPLVVADAVRAVCAGIIPRYRDPDTLRRCSLLENRLQSIRNQLAALKCSEQCGAAADLILARDEQQAREDSL